MSINVDPDWWKTMFDSIYLLTDARSVCDDDVTCLEVDLICELLPIRTGHKILDLCGGHGRHSFELYTRGYTACTLLDYSEYLVRYAKQQAVENNFAIQCIRSDARNTGLLSEKFDHICILGNSLGYIQVPDADNLILAEAYRMLNIDGWLLVDVTDGTAIKQSFNPNAWHEIDDDIIVCRQRELRDDNISVREIVLSKTEGLIRDRTYAIRLYDSKSISSLLERSGFKHINIHADFSPHKFKGDYGFMNKRIIAVGQKLS